jgi:hypothetical protein
VSLRRRLLAGIPELEMPSAEERLSEMMFAPAEEAVDVPTRGADVTGQPTLATSDHVWVGFRLAASYEPVPVSEIFRHQPEELEVIAHEESCKVPVSNGDDENAWLYAASSGEDCTCGATWESVIPRDKDDRPA